MTKRELIVALESCPAPDDTPVLKTSWLDQPDGTGMEIEEDLYDVTPSRMDRYDASLNLRKEVLVILL